MQQRASKLIRRLRSIAPLVAAIVAVALAVVMPFDGSPPSPSTALAYSTRECILLGAQGGPRSNSGLFVIDRNTGSVKTIGQIGYSVTGLAQDPVSGQLYGVTAGGGSVRYLLRIDPTTGAGTKIAQLTGVDFPAVPDISFRGDGVLFGWSEDDDDLVTIDTKTGVIAEVGESGLDTEGTGLAFATDGTLFLAGEGANGPLRRVDAVTGETFVVATLNNAPVANGGLPALAADPDSGILYGVNFGSRGTFLVTINTKTGRISSVGRTQDSLDALSFYCEEKQSNDPNNDDEKDKKNKKETEEERQQRERTNNSHRGDVTTEGNVLEVEKAANESYLLVTIGLSKHETLIVQVPCIDLRCPDIKIGDYLEADGYQNGVGDENTWFVAEEVTVLRGGTRVK